MKTLSLPLAKSQRGGTFLGIVIGLMVGLGTALAVALYVTKVPVPFTNKGATKSTAEQDAQEAQKNKNWDPNAPLYGKNAAKPTASGTVGTATATLGALPAAAAVSAAKPASAPKAPASAPKSSTDPLGDLAKAKTAGTAAAAVGSAATPGADPFTYFVQAGAFRTPEDAEAQKAKLSMAGFQALITEREQSGRTVFRVRVGPMDKKDDADKAKEKLDGAGFETAIVRVQR